MDTVSDSLKGLRILVAEDNFVNQKVIRIILEKAGCNYEIAEDGLQALKLYEQKEYDLVLMDCQMPQMDGLQTSIEIRNFEKLNQKQRCPIVAMTANSMKGDEERCISVGMDGFLSKPFKSQELVHIIGQWGRKGSL